MRSPLVALLVCFAMGSIACGEDRRPSRPPTSAGPASPPEGPTAKASLSASAAPSASASAAIDGEPDPASPPRAIDMHCDTPYQVKTKGHSLDLTEGQITPDTLSRGQAGGVFLAIYLSDKLHGGHPTIADADALFDTVDQIVAHHPETFWPPSKGRAPEGKVTAFVSIEGAGAFADDITQIDRFIDRGVRLVGLVHMKNDRLASSSTDAHSAGLTDLGKKFCERVYRKGALVDVSHMSDEGFSDVAVIAKRFHAPIVATHSDARAIADKPRNLTDAQLKAIGESGGIVGVNFYNDYLRVGGEASLADAVKQALHMIEVAGIDHVGIGSDFDGSTTPKDLPDASAYPAFAKALEAAGVGRGDVHKIFSENVRRVLRYSPPASEK